MVNMDTRPMRLALVIALCVAIEACGRAGAAEPATSAAWRFAVTVPVDGIAMLADTVGQELRTSCSRPAAAGVTNARRVRKAEIDELSGYLALEIARQLERAPDANRQADSALAGSPRIYYAQVVGIERDGRRLLYVNGFARDVVQDMPDSTQWHLDPIVSCAGGQGFFGVEYDPKARTLAGFAFNGTG